MSAHRNVVLGIALAVTLAGPAWAGTRIEKELPLAAGGQFTLETDAGGVAIKGTGRSGARVVITSSADDLESYWDFRFEQDAKGVRVIADRKEDSRSWFKRVPSPSFEVEVPTRTALSVSTAGGSVEVSDTEGRVSIDTAGGHIEIANVSGDAALDTAGGHIEVSGLTGTLDAETAGGSIQVHRVTGDTSVETAGGSITVTEAGGRVEAETSGGSVEVGFARGNGKGGSLSSMGGGIRIRVDPSVGLEIDASTMGGSVSTGLPVKIVGKAKRSSLRGTLGAGGASLTASTMGGSIRIDAIE